MPLLSEQVGRRSFVQNCVYGICYTDEAEAKLFKDKLSGRRTALCGDG